MIVRAEEFARYVNGTEMPENLRPLLLVKNSFFDAVAVLSAMNSCGVVAIADKDETKREIELKLRLVKANAICRVEGRTILIFDSNLKKIDEVGIRRSENEDLKFEGSAVFFTSGTTGEPKAIKHTSQNMIAVSKCEAEFIGVGDDDIFMTSAPLSFSYGFGIAVTIPLASNCSAFFPEITEIGDYVHVMDNATFFATTPTVLREILRSKDRIEVKNLKYILSAGEKLTSGLYNLVKRKIPGIEILEFLGTTETFHGIIHNTPKQLKPGSIGKPLPCYEVKVVRDGMECKPYEIGELIVKGPVGETLGRKQEEWLKTGDLVYYDYDGFFWYVSRKDEIINVAGMLVSPLEVEEVIMSSGLVKDCVVYGFPDPTSGERAVAEVIMDKGDLAELEEHLRQNLSEYKIPVLRIVDEIPKSRRGKKIRRGLDAKL